MKIIIWGTGLYLAILACGGCNQENGHPPSIEKPAPQILRHTAAKTFEKNRVKWSSTGISNYQYTFQRICFCPADDTAKVSITVYNNSVDSIRRVSDGKLIKPSSTGIYTIKQLFSLIQDADNKGADRLSVTYDDELGYPTSIDIDYEKALADDEVSIKISGLSQL